MRGDVLSICDRTGVMVQPWLDAGYRCWIVDAQHPAGEHHDGLLVRVGADILRWLPPRVSYFAAAFAFTPCTDVANSGNRWKQSKGLTALRQAIELFEASVRLLEWTGAPWMLENPVGSLSTYWRKPDYTFQPWHFGDLESKQTCLWTGGGFVMPPKEITERPAGVRESCWKMGPSADRGDKRSETPPGFARAVFMANCPLVAQPRLIDARLTDSESGTATGSATDRLSSSSQPGSQDREP